MSRLDRSTSALGADFWSFRSLIDSKDPAVKIKADSGVSSLCLPLPLITATYISAPLAESRRERRTPMFTV